MEIRGVVDRPVWARDVEHHLAGLRLAGVQRGCDGQYDGQCTHAVAVAVVIVNAALDGVPVQVVHVESVGLGNDVHNGDDEEAVLRCLAETGVGGVAGDADMGDGDGRAWPFGLPYG